MDKRHSEAEQERISEQFRKLFIGGLTPNTTEEKLRKYYQQWGDLVDAVVMKDCNSGRSRGFGFVTYKEVFMVDEAQNNRPHDIDGKIVEAKRAMPREDSIHPEAHMTVTKLFVGGLKKELGTRELIDYFSDFGTVIDCEIVSWKDTGESRGFGFVLFDDYDPVDKAILYKPHFIHSSKVDVKKALSKEEICEIKRKKQHSHHYQKLAVLDEEGTQRQFPTFESRNVNKYLINTTQFTVGEISKSYSDDTFDPSYYTGGYNSSGIFPKSKGCTGYYSPALGFYSQPNIPFNYYQQYPQCSGGPRCLSSLVRNIDWKPTPLASYSQAGSPVRTEVDLDDSNDSSLTNVDQDCHVDDCDISDN